MDLNLPAKLLKALEKEAADARISLHAQILKKLESITPPVACIDIAKVKNGLPKLVELLNRIPAVDVIAHEATPSAYWWVKFTVDIQHPLAWCVVQALAFVFNEISISEKLPTIFKPTSPPPYLNGGPDESLFWVVESTYNYIDPHEIAQIVEERLPHPVEQIDQWKLGDTEPDDEWIPDYPYRPELPPAQPPPLPPPLPPG